MADTKSASDKLKDPASPVDDLPVDEAPKRRRVSARCLFCHRWWTPVLWVLGMILVAAAVAVPVVLEEKPWKADDPNFDFSSTNATSTPNFVSVEWLVEQMASERGVTVLDAREPPSTFATQAGLNRNIPGSVRSRWPDFMNGEDLKSPEEMGQEYRNRGVFNERPVVVYGGWSAANFFGEEGRVWWQLHWLNHTDAHILYGGIWAWDNSIHKGEASRGEPGDFAPRPVPERLISTPEVLDLVQNEPESIFLIDVRGTDEFNGAAPFGSEYGGHIGGAVSYPWRDVFDANGILRPLDTIRSELLALGYQEGQRMIVYCTRGVRASFAVATFVGAGFNVTMHEGSWREWTQQVPEAESRAIQDRLG